MRSAIVASERLPMTLPPATSTRRFLLREATAKAHAALEARVGALTSRGAYEAYLQGLHAFRTPVEPLLAAAVADALPGFAPDLIAPELAADLRDLGLAAIAPEAAPDVSSPSRALGALYVLEGSALGARVLLPQVRTLGFDADHGARHLALQPKGAGWREFVTRLDAAVLDDDAVIAGADDAFRAAGRAMARAHAASVHV